MAWRADHWTALAYGVTVLLAGSNAVGIRFSNFELPPFWGATLRFGAASLVFVLLMLALRVPVPRGRALGGAMLYGLFGFGLAYAFAYWALQTVPAGVGQVVLALTPLFTILLASSQGLESFRWRALAGALVAFGGIAVQFWESLASAISPWGLLAAVASAACFAQAAIIAKRFPKSHPVSTNAVAMATGMTLLLALSVAFGEAFVLPRRAETWAAVAYLVFIGSVVVFALYLVVLKRWSATSVSYQFVLLPFVTVLVAGALAGETISPAFLLAAGLVLLGVYVGALAPARKRAGTAANPAAADPPAGR